MFNIKFNSKSSSPTTKQSIDLANSFESSFDKINPKMMVVHADKANDSIVKIELAPIV